LQVQKLTKSLQNSIALRTMRKETQAEIGNMNNKFRA
jgi:hypothetical protein